MTDPAPPPRWPLRAGIALLLLALAVAAAWPAVLRWQKRRAFTVAAAFLDQRDFRSASLAARQLLAHDPSDPDALALLAEIARTAGSPETLLWLQRLADTHPRDDRLLALAHEALARRELPIAAQALARLSPATRDSTEGHTLAASLDVLETNWPSAAAHLREAARLAPGDPHVALNLATLTLRDPHGPQAPAARAELEHLAEQPTVRLPALRALLNDTRIRGDTAGAHHIALVIHDLPEAGPADRLLLLEELQAHAPGQFDAAITRQQTAATDPAAIATLARWMNQHRLAPRAAAWIDSLPPATRALPLLLSVRADSAVASADWPALRQLSADDRDWQGLEFLRLAFAARAAAGTAGHREAADTRWQRAVHATVGSYAALSLLAGTAHEWGWDTEAAEIWWLLARQPAGARAALQRAWQLAHHSRDTAALLHAARRIAEIEPKNPAARNNLAWLLLLRGEDLPHAHALAAENHAQHPRDPLLRATAAFSLHVQSRHAEAAALLDGLPPNLAREPSVAACAGIVLAAAGRRDEARAHLEIARAAADKLLPEERALVEKAAAP